MIRNLAICAALLFIVTGVRADDPAKVPVIDAGDKAAIAAHMEKEVVITGKIARAEWSRSGKVMNIDFENVGESGLLAVIFERNRKAMDEAFGGDVSKSLTGSNVRLEGILKPYGGRDERMKDRPQIILDRITQITIINPPPASQPAN